VVGYTNPPESLAAYRRDRAMSKKSSKTPYLGGLPEETFQVKGMTFKALQQKYPTDHLGREWVQKRTSRRGNRVMDGIRVVAYDPCGEYGGKAYAYYVTAIVRPDDTVAKYTVVYDEWAY